MNNYGLSRRQLESLQKFSNIFTRNNKDMVLDCILLILCIWDEDKDQLINGRGLDFDISEIDFSIELPDNVEDELYELSDYYDLSIHDCINGIVGLVLGYLELNWSGEFDLESDNMTDQDKMIELTKENGMDDPCWIKYFTPVLS
jgi:hypothetical protein